MAKQNARVGNRDHRRAPVPGRSNGAAFAAREYRQTSVKTATDWRLERFQKKP
jgi:hypothetical protein